MWSRMAILKSLNIPRLKGVGMPTMPLPLCWIKIKALTVKAGLIYQFAEQIN